MIRKTGVKIDENYLLLILLSISSLAYGDWTKVTFNDDTTMFTDSQTIKRKGDIYEVLITDFDKKTNLDNMKMTFSGLCAKGQQKF